MLSVSYSHSRHPNDFSRKLYKPLALTRGARAKRCAMGGSADLGGKRRLGTA
jgi:hypothetical protein